MGHEYVKEGETFNTTRNGTVPKPTSSEVSANKFLRADGTWQAGGSGATELDELTDVDITSPADGDVLTYDESTGTWQATEPITEEVALSDLTDTSISSPSNGQVLTYDENQDAWVNANGSGGASDLDDLGDVSISSATNGQVLKYDSTSSKWINANESGGGASTLNDLTDVDTTGVSDNNVLAYDAGTSKWVPAVVSGGSTTLSGLTDVNTSGVSDGNALVYDSSSSKWIPATVSGGNVDDVEVNGTSVVTNKIAQITSYKELTRAEYDALPDTKLTDGVMYCIKDGFSNPNGFPPLIYSTEEREIGVWTDGKPLYERTFEYTLTTAISGSSSGELVDLVSLPSVNMKKMEGYVYDGAYPLPFVSYSGSRGTQLCMLRYISDYIKLYDLNTPWTVGTTFVITAQYTKTTDTAGSGKWATDGGLAKHYSTQEQIIGTWIDGKPVYEKSYLYENSSGSTYGSDITIDDNFGTDKQCVPGGLQGMFYATSGANYPVPWTDIGSSGNNGTSTGLFISGDGKIKLRIRNDTYGNNYKLRITARYTKTTD